MESIGVGEARGMSLAYEDAAAVNSSPKPITLLGLPTPPSPTMERREHDRVRPGAILLGRYRIERELGRGGMAVVLAASHITIGAPVAIKVLHASLSARRAAADRFLTEARAIAAVQHPNVVRVSDYGELSDGRPFMVMEYLRGRDLARELEGTAGLPWSTVRPILLQVCAALQAAHDVGIVHRDVKPQNIFLLDEGSHHARVKVLDFGIAKVTDTLRCDLDDDGEGDGAFVGTPDYMAPEQSSGVEVDARADIYALGVTLYRALTGKLPFVSEHWFHTVTQHMYRTPPRPRSINPSIPKEVEAIILRAMAKQPDDRFVSMRALAEAAEAAPDESEPAISTSATIAHGERSMSVPTRASGRGLVVATTAVAAIAAGLWLGWSQLGPEQATSTQLEPVPAVRAAATVSEDDAPTPRLRAPLPRVESAMAIEPVAEPEPVVAAPPPPIEPAAKPEPRSHRVIRSTPVRTVVAAIPVPVAEPEPEPEAEPEPEPEAEPQPAADPEPARTIVAPPTTKPGLRIEEVKNPFGS